MGLDKNFVVRNGLEISSDLIYADALLNKTGIGTTTPGSKLDVSGDTSVSGDFRATGIATVGGVFDVGIGGTALKVDNGTQKVGVNNVSPEYNLDVSGDVGVSSHLKIGGITTSYGFNVEGDSNLNDLKVTGINTIVNARIEAGFTTVTYSEAQYLNVTGVGTAASLDVTNFNGLGISTVSNLYVSGVSTHPDSIKATFGNDSDLEIYHDGSHSYIDDTGTGNLKLRTNNFKISNVDESKTSIIATPPEGVELYYDGTRTLKTSGVGVTVYGTTETDQLVVTGVTTLGVVTSVASLGVGSIYATEYYGDGSKLTGIDTSGNFQGKTIVCENVNASSPGIGTFGSIVINSPTGRITATEYYGDGTNLTNTGAELSPASGTQRLVLTGLTTDRMVSTATTSTLTYDVSTDTVSSTNISASADVSSVNVSASSSVTATNFYGDGANLTNTGSTLEGIDSTERLVTTGITTGNTMVSSGTTSTLTYNPTTDTLFCTNFSGNGSNLTNTGSTLQGIDTTERLVTTGINTGSTMVSSGTTSTLTYNPTTDTLFCTNVSGSFSGSGASLNSIPNGALDNSTISGVSLGSTLATLTRGSYLTGSDYDGSTATTWDVDADTANTADKVVVRDSSGDFAAGTITATLSGNASSATDVRVDSDDSTNATRYITFSDSGGGSNNRIKVDSSLSYNPSTNTLTVANLSGNASTASNATNAGTLDGYDSSQSATGNTVAVRDSDGDLNVRYLVSSYCNMSHSRTTRNSDTTFYSSTDDYIRKNDASGMRTSLNVPTRTGGNASGTWGINITGDAGTVDGLNASSFLRSDANDTATGDITFNGKVNIRGHIDLSDNEYLYFGSGDDVEFFCNGSHMYMDLNSGIGNFYIRDGSTTRFTFDDAGSFTATSNITAYSDVTLKENINIIPNAIEKISSIRGVTYNRKDLKDNPRHAGVIAQEVEKVLPEVVSIDEEGIKSVAYGNMVGLLIEAIKEQQVQINQLKQQIGGTN